MENLRKKKSNRNPGNKKSHRSNKKHSGRSVQQNRTSGRQLSQLENKIDVKEKNRRNLSQTTQEW
jgi:hypothetical protein